MNPQLTGLVSRGSGAGWVSGLMLELEKMGFIADADGGRWSNSSRAGSGHGPWACRGSGERENGRKGTKKALGRVDTVTNGDCAER